VARDREILEPVLEQAYDLIAPNGRLDPELARRDPLQQRVAIAAQAEEVVSLLGGHQLECRVLDAAPVHDLGGLLELLAAGAVEALVVPDVEVVRVVALDAP
jgi:hypothetical protein